MSLVFFTRYNSFRAYDNLKRERCVLQALFPYILANKLKDKRIVMDLSQDDITQNSLILVRIMLLLSV